jgi:hypothetical protein
MRTLVRILVPFTSLVVGAAAVALHGGCGASAPPSNPTTVRGRVTFQGKPVAGGLVVFAPDPDRGGAGRPARAQTGPDGTFQLRLGDAPQIPPGWYRVAIAGAPGTPTEPDAVRFPPQLMRPDRSGLVREVAAGRENVFDFAVEVPPG